MISKLHRLALLLPPEIAHNLSMASLRQEWVKKEIKKIHKNYSHYKKNLEIAGLKFDHPIGLAAGLDKNAEAVESLSYLGFSFLEVGTVTPQAQKGNPKPRLFRLKEKASLINRMGFNNQGAETLKENLAKASIKKDCLLGINIGKNKSTANENALEDYSYLLKDLKSHCDYMTVNLSSPNTPGLRDLQNLNFLEKLSKILPSEKPVFLKIAPDLSFNEMTQIVEALDDLAFSGLILTNTLSVRNHRELFKKYDSGGISGALLRIPSREALVLARKRIKKPIISVGGIDSADEIRWRLDHGADLVQVYTAFVYQGVEFVFKALEELYGSNSK